MESLSNVLFSLYRGSPQHGEWLVACLRGAWSHIVGEGIARVCQPVLWKDYRLVIRVEDPAWKKHLTDLEGELVEKLRSATGDEIRSISLELNTSPL